MKIIWNDDQEIGEEDNPPINTYGGEAWIDDFHLDEYSIQIGNLTIADIPSKELIKLATTMVNHLIVNGHRFEFVEDRDSYTKLRQV
jgi:hypothetical protein